MLDKTKTSSVILKKLLVWITKRRVDVLSNMSKPETARYLPIVWFSQVTGLVTCYPGKYARLLFYYHVCFTCYLCAICNTASVKSKQCHLVAISIKCMQIYLLPYLLLHGLLTCTKLKNIILLLVEFHISYLKALNYIYLPSNFENTGFWKEICFFYWINSLSHIN